MSSSCHHNSNPRGSFLFRKVSNVIAKHPRVQCDFDKYAAAAAAANVARKSNKVATAVDFSASASRASTRSNARPPGSRWPDVVDRARYSASCIRPGIRCTAAKAAMASLRGGREECFQLVLGFRYDSLV